VVIAKARHLRNRAWPRIAHEIADRIRDRDAAEQLARVAEWYRCASASGGRLSPGSEGTFPLEHRYSILAIHSN
jgi:hypothetical protein